MGAATLGFVTWNIQWGRGVDGRVDLPRIVSCIGRWRDVDVVMLQEVADGFASLPGHDGSDQFAALAALLPGYECIQAAGTEVAGRGGRRQRFGNVIATRLPVRQVWRHLLPWPMDPGGMSMQRVALETCLDTPLGPLRVTTTHLEYYSARQRAAQVQRLRELHAEAVQHGRGRRPGGEDTGPFVAVPRGAPAVLAGDMNCTPGSDELQALLHPFDDGTPAYRDAWPALHGAALHPWTVGLHDKAQWPDGPRTFDFFLVSEDLAPRVRHVEVDAAVDASDHQPVLLRLDAAP
ncbi:MAG TPA: endonuclease/exonuclease/phosphatase family protein [Albitalea sp.]